MPGIRSSNKIREISVTATAAKKANDKTKRKRESLEEEEEIPEIVLLRRKNIARNQAMMAALSFNQLRQVRPNRKQSYDKYHCCCTTVQPHLSCWAQP